MDGQNKLQRSQPKASSHTLDHERAVIGACLLGGTPAVDDAMVANLRAADFARREHGILWAAIMRLHEGQSSVDTLTVVDELHRTSQLDAVGGSAAVSQLEAMMPTTAHVGAYAAHVAEAANLRRIMETAHIFATAAANREGSASEILAGAQQAFLMLNRRATDDMGIVDRKATLDRIVSRLGKSPEGTLPTGFTDLDPMMRGGLVPGGLYVVAARPAMGKSAFGHQLAAQIADIGVPTALMSLEMTGEELLTREIASRARAAVDSWDRRDEASRVVRAAAELEDRPLTLIDRAGLDIAGVCMRARRLVHRDGVALLVVDYVGLVRSGDRYRGDKTNEIGEVTACLKELAQNLRIPVVMLAQLNRESTKRPDKRPQLQDLRDSGAIEQDANVVMFLHREEYYRPNDCPEELRRVCEVIVAKNRNGPCGTVQLIFDGPTTRFANMARDPVYE